LINKNNFYYEIEQDSKIYFSFYHKKKKNLIGQITLINYKNDIYETHSYIAESDYVGIGFGVFMYSVVIGWCIKNGYKITSSEIERQSTDAIRLWKSRTLRKNFNITLEGSRWVVQCGAIQ